MRARHRLSLARTRPVDCAVVSRHSRANGHAAPGRRSRVGVLRGPDEERTWVFDVTFLTQQLGRASSATGCHGVLTGPAPELVQGCCSYGAHFTGQAGRRAGSSWRPRRSPRRSGSSQAGPRAGGRSRPTRTARSSAGWSTARASSSTGPDFPGGPAARCTAPRSSAASGRSTGSPTSAGSCRCAATTHTDDDGHVMSTIARVEAPRLGRGRRRVPLVVHRSARGVRRHRTRLRVHGRRDGRDGRPKRLRQPGRLPRTARPRAVDRAPPPGRPRPAADGRDRRRLRGRADRVLRGAGRLDDAAWLRPLRRRPAGTSAIRSRTSPTPKKSPTTPPPAGPDRWPTRSAKYTHAARISPRQAANRDGRWRRPTSSSGGGRRPAGLRPALRALDDGFRVPWGLGMKRASFVTARLMEHWAHGLDIRAGLGVDAVDTAAAPPCRVDRLQRPALCVRCGRRNAPDGHTLRLDLTGPGGEAWSYGPADATDTISRTGWRVVPAGNPAHHAGRSRRARRPTARWPNLPSRTPARSSRRGRRRPSGPSAAA